MLNLFKHQWLPDYIRDYIVKKFPAKHFKVTFEINGHEVPMDQVVGNERHVKRGNVTYTDAEGDSTTCWLFLRRGEITFDSVSFAVDNFALEGIEPGVRKLPRVGKKDEVDKYRKMLKKKLSEAMDYCPGSFWTNSTNTPLPTCPAGAANAS